MKLSVIIPTYNEGENLFKTVQSVIALQDEIGDAEVIVADDGSTDGSVAKTKTHYPQIVVNSHPRPYGTSCGKALGADAARGEVMLFLDAHTKPAPGALDKLAQLALRYGVACPAVDGLNTETWTANRKRSAGMYVDLNDSWHCLWKNREHLPVLSENVYRTYAIPGESFAIRRDVYDAVGGWDRGLISWGSDASLSLRLFCLGHTVVHCPQARIAHRFSKGFVQYDPHWWQIFANRIRILRSLGTPEEIELFSRAMKASRKDAYDAALKYADANDSTIPRLQHRLVHSLMDYVSVTAGHRRWLAVEGWLSAREGEALQNLVRGKRVLEIGAYQGRSACCMAEFAEHVISVDPHDCRSLPRDRQARASLGDMLRNLDRFGLREKVEIVAVPIEDVESRFADDSFDVVFIDGDHRYEAVVRDLRIARRAVKPGGVIAVHDYGNRAGVTQAVDELKLPFKQVETLVILENV